MSKTPRDIVAECLVWPPLKLCDFNGEFKELVYQEADRMIDRLNQNGYEIVPFSDAAAAGKEETDGK